MAPSFMWAQALAILAANNKLKASVFRKNKPHGMKEAQAEAVICD